MSTFRTCLLVFKTKSSALSKGGSGMNNSKKLVDRQRDNANKNSRRKELVENLRDEFIMRTGLPLLVP